MSHREFDEDLTQWRIRREALRLTARSEALRRFVLPGAAAAPGLDERLKDHLCTSGVAGLWSAAHSAPEGVAGEVARRRFRLIASPFLESRVAEQQAELLACRKTLERPERGFEYEIVANPSRAGRRSLHRRWSDHEARLAELRTERTRAALAAAKSVGAGSLCEFNAVREPVDVEPICRRYEAALVAPLDAAVERASRDRRRRSPLPLCEPEHPADSPLLARLAAHRERFPAAAIPAVLRHLGQGLGMDPDAGGPGVVVDPEACFRPCSGALGSGALVLIGSLEGPGALTDALDAFGRSARYAFVTDLRGVATAAAGDPAFETAAGVLFARLVLAPPFRARFGPRPEAGLDADLRLEAALAPRLAWTYLYLVLRSRETEVEPWSAETRRALRRALGRPAAVDQALVAYACDPCGASALRGTVLALLLEERLMSRWGREWFAEERAGRFLRECWEAEDGQTAESVADALDLGTIEPTPILDGCRP